LTAVSEAGRQSPMWVYYMGKTRECLGNTEQAIGYYRKYNTLVPGQEEVLEKIAELQYLFGNALSLFRDLVNSAKPYEVGGILDTQEITRADRCTMEFSFYRKYTDPILKKDGFHDQYGKCTISLSMVSSNDVRFSYEKEYDSYHVIIKKN